MFYVPDLAKKNLCVVMLGKKDCCGRKCCCWGGIQPIWRNSILWHFIQAPTLGN
jgi:hypothetical protein